MAASEAVHLDPRLIDEIADRLADRLGDAIVELVAKAVSTAGRGSQTPKATAWLDATEVAQRLGVDRDWVYEHANELGASRLGSGPRPRLRFPPDVLDSKPQPEMTSPRRKPTGLIPIHAE